MTDRLASVRTQSRSSIVAALRAARAERRGGHAPRQAIDAPAMPCVAADDTPEITTTTHTAPAEIPTAAPPQRPRRWVGRRAAAAQPGAPLVNAPAMSKPDIEPEDVPEAATSPTQRASATSDAGDAATAPSILTVKVAGSLFAGMINAAAEVAATHADVHAQPEAPAASMAASGATPDDIDEDASDTAAASIGPDVGAPAEVIGTVAETVADVQAMAADDTPADEAAPDVGEEPSAEPAAPTAEADASAEPEPEPEPEPQPEPETGGEAEPEAAPEAEPGPIEIALTVIPGLGPGVSLRLERLGYRTIADLSSADPDEVKGALGEISRLLDVDQWISHARQLAEDAPHG